jgi:GT2 family glycosyltransferase
VGIVGRTQFATAPGLKTLSSQPDITIVAQSPDLAADAIEVVVTLPTFRRPKQVLATLDSLRAQATRRRFAIVVMENDDEGREGAGAASAWLQDAGVPGVVIIAHQRGNCCAYNAGWQVALEAFPNLRHIAVIDDDEIAHAGWLEALCATAERLGADIVGGPQLPVFADGAAQRYAGHPVFAPPYAQTGLVPALFSSGNLLISRAVLDAMERPFLDLRFNFMGGGDADFLSRAAQRGFRLGWAAEAIVEETVPARRLEWDWIRARSLRNGVISTLVEKRKRAGTPLAGAKVLGKSLALLAASPLRGVVRLARTGSLATGLYPVYVAAGRVMAEFGYANEQYRQPEKN